LDLKEGPFGGPLSLLPQLGRLVNLLVTKNDGFMTLLWLAYDIHA
jgi:hypothetical protein